MKNLYKLLGSALLIAFFAAGCDTDTLQDMNLNPNAVNTIDVNYFLTAAELSASNNGLRDDRYTDWRTNIGMCAHAIQHLASTSTGTISVGDKYLENDVEPSNAPWDHFFAGDGRVTAEIIKQTGPGGYAEGHNINTVMPQGSSEFSVSTVLPTGMEVSLILKPIKVLKAYSNLYMISRKQFIQIC